MRDAMLILHFIGLAMGLGTGFGHAFLGAGNKDLTGNERTTFRLRSLALGTMGNIGIVLLLVSGLYMITPYWKVITSYPLLITKLVLVFLLIVVITLINIASSKARKGDAENQFKKMEVYGKMTLLLALAIVIIAVKVFH